MANNQAAVVIKSSDDLKLFLHNNYLNQIRNFFGDEKQAMKFLSSVMSSVQKLPKLLECEPMSVVNSFMTMAQLALMPSDVSGEAYVLPYGNVAQFQLGYQGLVTLFYRAGGQSIRSGIVREHDEFSFDNGVIQHKVNFKQSMAQRGAPVGAYAIAKINGEEMSEYMNQEDILKQAKMFSKSFNSSHTPWKEASDPNLWMWRKTVLKQLGKLLPKNETIAQAIAADNEDSDLKKPLGSMVEDSNLKMGGLLKGQNNENTNQTPQEGGAPKDVKAANGY